MDRERIQALTRAQGQTGTRGRVQIDIEKDLGPECRFVDFLLASSLRTGKCARLLRNFMVIYAAKVPQLAQGENHLFDPEGICQTIKVLEGHEIKDITRGPFQFEKGPLKGLYKKHFFQASFLIENIIIEIEKHGSGIISRKLAEYYGKGNYMGKPLKETDVELIAEAFSRDVIERRAASREKTWRGGLTGEHLIYAARPDGNIYLHASFHGEDPDRIAESVRVALSDFPELRGAAPVFD